MSSTGATTTTLNTTQGESVSGTDVEKFEQWMTSKTPRIVFLSVFIAIGFVGNLLLIITVCHSRRFRSAAFFIFVTNLAVTNICECALNMSILMASSVMKEWKFGEIACRMSSFFLNLILIETILGLTICTADRFVAMRFKESYDHVFSTPRIAILIGVTWLQSFAFSIPIVIGVIPTTVNSYIVYCYISKSSSVIYSVINAALCFVVPLILMVTFFIIIIRTGYKERFEIRNIISQRNYEEDSTEEPQIQLHIRHANMTGTICIVWLALEGPHIVTAYLKLFKNSPELQDLSTKDLEYVWYVDLVLLWLRFSYVMALPIASFVWNKDLWKSFKDMILCRKNNSVVDESFKKCDTDTFRLDKNIKEQKIKENEAIISARESRLFQIPVLFATSHGVHIQTTTCSDSENDEDNETSKSISNGTLRGKKCDVIGSRDNLNNMEDDTSDYDSGNEPDPFSVSHPISVNQLNEAELTDRKRSNSESEVLDKKDILDKSNGRTVGSSSEGDSGLDLSTGTYCKTLKRKETFHTPDNKNTLHDTQNQLQTELIETNLYTRPLHQFNEVKKDNFVSEYARFPNSISNATDESNEFTNKNNEITVSNDTDTKSNEDSGNSFGKVSEDFNEADIPALAITKETIIDTTESPLPKKKKKRNQKENALDAQSVTSVTSLTGIPPRPPPRLAPIAALGLPGIKSLYSGTGRPGSSCSSQCSVGDYRLDGRHSVLSCDSCSDMLSLKSEQDNMSVSSMTLSKDKRRKKCKHKKKLKSYNERTDDDAEILRLDVKREIKSVPEEILTPTDCHISGNFNQTNSADDLEKTNDADNENHNAVQETDRQNALEVQDDDPGTQNTRSRVRNVPARQKRRERTARERMSPSSLLKDHSGYERLVSESP